MWFKCVGVALVVSASALCFPLQAAAQSEYAAPVGTAQTRGVRFEGELIILRPPPCEIDGIIHHRELTWERISPV